MSVSPQITPAPGTTAGHVALKSRGVRCGEFMLCRPQGRGASPPPVQASKIGREDLAVPAGFGAHGRHRKQLWRATEEDDQEAWKRSASICSASLVSSGTSLKQAAIP
jgi:hypothetical protein